MNDLGHDPVYSNDERMPEKETLNFFLPLDMRAAPYSRGKIDFRVRK